MRYRTLSKDAARQIRNAFIEQTDYSLDALSDEQGEGESLDISLISQIAQDAAKFAIAHSPESAEHHFSGPMFMALRNVPVEIRDDKGFWRWLTVGPLLPFTIVRETPPKMETLGIGSNSPDILAVRMFLRGQVTRLPSADGSLEFSLAFAPGTDSHDFWQSHVLRRTTGAERELAKAMIRLQADPNTRMSSNVVRPFVRDHINRKKRTRATFLMSENEAAQFLAQELQVFRPDLTPEDPDDDDF